MPPTRSNNSLSVISVISAGLGWGAVPVWFCVGFIPLISLCVTPLIVLIPVSWVTAIATGHLALNELKTSGQEGRSYAIIGLILGYVGLALAVLAVIGLVVVIVLSNGNILPLPPQ